jgi:hypothetical protein
MASIDLVDDALSQDNDGVAFPAVLKPTDGVAPTAAQTFEWVKQHSDLLEAALVSARLRSSTTSWWQLAGRLGKTRTSAAAVRATA